MIRFVFFGFAMVAAFMSATSITLAASTQSYTPVTTFPDKREFVALLKARAFSQLDDRLSALQAAYEAGEAPEVFVESVFFAFANFDPSIESLLDEWVETMPASYAAHLARGRYHQNIGWLNRGGQYAGKTPKERFSDMLDSFARAIEDMKRAIELNAKLSVAYADLIQISMAASRRDAVREWYDAGLAVMPSSTVIRYRYLHSLEPWWGGSLEEIKAYIREIEPLFAEQPELRVLGGFLDYVLGDQLQRDDKEEQAFEYFERAVAHGDGGTAIDMVSPAIICSSTNGR